MAITASTEEKIRKTAVRLFLEKGFERTSIREIARHARINIALLNYYFRSKENLFNSIFTQLLGRYTPELHDILNTEMPIENKVRLYVNKYIDILIENPKLTYFVLSVLHRNPGKISRMKIFQKLHQNGNFSKQLHDEAAAGNIRETDPTHFFLNMISMITFPFTVKRIIMEENGIDERGFLDFMNERKKIITELLLLSLKKTPSE